MIDETIYRLLRNSDDYIKIFIIIWIKTREIYLDYNQNNNNSLHKKIESLHNFCHVIRKKCEKTNKMLKFSKILKFIEKECRNNRDKIDKIYNITSILKMFDLPKPLNEIIDTLGLSNPDESDFANVINDLFDEEVNIKEIVTDTKNDEGTLAELVNERISKLQDIPINDRKEVQIKKINKIKNFIDIEESSTDNKIIVNEKHKNNKIIEIINDDYDSKNNLKNNIKNNPITNENSKNDTVISNNEISFINAKESLNPRPNTQVKRDSIHLFFSNQDKNKKNEVITNSNLNNLKNGQKKIAIDLSSFGIK